MLGLRGINIKYILFCNHYLRLEQKLAMNIYFTCYDDKSDICKSGNIHLQYANSLPNRMKNNNPISQ